MPKRSIKANKILQKLQNVESDLAGNSGSSDSDGDNLNELVSQQNESSL